MQRLWSQPENISQSATPARKEMRRSAVVGGDVRAEEQLALFGTRDRSCYCRKDFNGKNILSGLPSAASHQQLKI